MNGFRFQAGWVIGFCLFIQVSATALDNFPDYPPSQNPAFELITSSTTHVQFLFVSQPDGSGPPQNFTESVYIGLPPSTIHQVELTEWEIQRVQADNTVIESVSGSLSTAGLNVREVERLLRPGVNTLRHEYQELDVLEIQFSFPQTVEISDATSAYQRDKIVPHRLTYKVTWRPRGTRTPSPQQNHEAGFTKIFENLVLNNDTVRHLRGKRTLPTTERTEGFQPYSSGYREEGLIINRIHHPDDENAVQPRTDGVRISVRQNGVIAVRPHDLEIQGVDPSWVVLNHVQVWHQGKEVNSSVWDADQDHLFNEDDAIYFYGRESTSPFTNDNPYFLTWGSPASTPKRVNVLPEEEYLTTQSVHTAHQVIHENRVLGMESIHSGRWFYAQLDEQRTEIPIDLPEINEKGMIELTLSWMNTNNSAAGLTALIGEASQSFSIGIESATQIRFQVPAREYIQSPSLVLLLDQQPPTYTTDSSNVKKQVIPRLFLDEIHIRYPKHSSPSDSPVVLMPDSLSTVQLQTATDTLVTAWIIHENEITHSIRPDRPLSEITLPYTQRDRVEIYPAGEEPGPYTIDQDYPSTLHRKDQGFDYILIAHHTLIDEARRLASRREQEGFRVLLTDVQDIYDEFNHGFPGHDPIKRFLRYAQSEWEGVSPEYVLLVGESSWDHRDYEGLHTVDQIPSYAPVDDPQRYASDEWYAYLWDEEDNVFSDVMIGRLSVSTPEEVKRYVDKAVTYETEAPVGLWKGRNLFISDDNFWRHSYESAKTGITEKLNPAFVNQNDFLHETSPYLYERFHNHPNESLRNQYSNMKISSQATFALIKALDEGALIAQYYGHGGAQIWSHERLFYATDRHTSNILELQPTNKFPFILNWSCLTGYLNINQPPFDVCLAEEFVRYDDRGAIAVWAPSENGYTVQHERMSHIVVRNLIQDGLIRLGQATTLTKAEYLFGYNGSDDYKLMEQYILFGDPAVELAVPSESLALTETPEYLLPNQENTLSLQTESQTVMTGKAVVSLSLEGINIYESQPLPIRQGLIQHTWQQEIDPTQDEYAIMRVYAWDEESNTDAWGGVKIPVMNPEIALGEGAVSLEHNPHSVVMNIQNRSPFPVSGMECVLSYGDQAETIPIDSIKPHSLAKIEWKGILPLDVDWVYVEIRNPSDIPVRFEKNETKTALPVPRENQDRILPLFGLMSLSPAEAIHESMTRVQIPFQNLSHNTALSATTYLIGPGSATTEKQINLTPDQTRQLVYNITPTETGLQDYSLRVVTDDRKTEYPFQLDVKDKPDLALAEGDVTIYPETPIIGRTVVFKTHVYNMGESTARNVMVSAFDGDPENNIKLHSFRANYNNSITEIAPGEMKEVEILWDPTGYGGLGVHEIHIVVDPYNRIEELSDDNNRSVVTLTLSDLPDLEVNPWSTHHIHIDTENNRIPVWGEPMRLSARVRNIGDTEAEYVRVSFLYNQEELTKFISRIRPNTAGETQVEIPLLSTRHSLIVEADKYNLIAEKNEFSGEDNNISREKRKNVQLQMPLAKLENLEKNLRRYEVSAETQFAAGLAEHIVFDPKASGITLSPLTDKAQLRLIPEYVENPQNYDFQNANTLWQWNIKYNSFLSPINSDAELRFKVPALNGRFEVYAQIYSVNPDQNATGTIQVKASGDREYQTLVYQKQDDPDSFRHIGTYTTRDDSFTIEFKSIPGGFSSAIGSIKFIKHAEDDSPVSAGYLSPYFPAPDAAGIPEITWVGNAPEGTDLAVKARWVIQNPDGTLRFLPWSRNVQGGSGSLKAVGKGDFLQYYAEFTKTAQAHEAPSLSKIEITIPCKP